MQWCSNSIHYYSNLLSIPVRLFEKFPLYKSKEIPCHTRTISWRKMLRIFKLVVRLDYQWYTWRTPSSLPPSNIRPTGHSGRGDYPYRPQCMQGSQWYLRLSIETCRDFAWESEIPRENNLNAKIGHIFSGSQYILGGGSRLLSRVRRWGAGAAPGRLVHPALAAPDGLRAELLDPGRGERSRS